MQARARELERIVDIRVLTSVGRTIHTTKSPISLLPSVDIAQQAWDGPILGLRHLKSCFDDGRQFIEGERVTMADCAFVAALQFACYAEFPIETGYGNILHWGLSYRDRQAANTLLMV